MMPTTMGTQMGVPAVAEVVTVEGDDAVAATVNPNAP